MYIHFVKKIDNRILNSVRVEKNRWIVVALSSKSRLEYNGEGLNRTVKIDPYTEKEFVVYSGPFMRLAAKFFDKINSAEVNELDVHTSHCCYEHGCKYNKSDCSVELGIKYQEKICRTCSEEYDYF